MGTAGAIAVLKMRYEYWGKGIKIEWRLFKRCSVESCWFCSLIRIQKRCFEDSECLCVYTHHLLACTLEGAWLSAFALTDVRSFLDLLPKMHCRSSCFVTGTLSSQLLFSWIVHLTSPAALWLYTSSGPLVGLVSVFCAVILRSVPFRWSPCFLQLWCICACLTCTCVVPEVTTCSEICKVKFSLLSASTSLLLPVLFDVWRSS